MYDLIFNGNIISLDQYDSIYNWIYIKDGLIKDAGVYDGYMRYQEFCNKPLDLKGRTILPSFIDSHVYLIQTGINKLAVDLSQAKCFDDIFNALRDRAKTIPNGQLIRGVKFDEFNLKEKRFPTRYELDRHFPDHPIWINRVEMHTSLVNSYALSQLKVPFNMPGVHEENGKPTGVIYDRANAYIRNKFYSAMTDEHRNKGVSLAIQHALEYGVTTVNAIEAGFAFCDSDGDFIYEHQNEMPIDVVLFYQTIDLEKLKRMGISRVGCIFLDGSIGSRTAAVSIPYCDEDANYGSLYYSEQSIKEFVLRAHKMDFQIAIHAVGDRAIDLALDAFENALTLYPKRNHRHRIEHFELPSKRAIRRMSDLNIIASMVPNAPLYWSHKEAAYGVRLGEIRLESNNPFREILDMGVKIAGGSDSDITDMHPFSSIHVLVNESNLKRKTTLKQALKMFTIDAAYAIFQDSIKGSIEINKYADFIIIDQNPFEIDQALLKDTQILMTIKEGKVLYQRLEV
ncbi:amidohydrolase [Wukongibacter baidiensis]|uniref:amidohydrolase n=1 Tax=Wukongibacter baidiensis TaxID=1723361 RepID=UPI003D7F6AB2